MPRVKSEFYRTFNSKLHKAYGYYYSQKEAEKAVQLIKVKGKKALVDYSKRSRIAVWEEV